MSGKWSWRGGGEQLHGGGHFGLGLLWGSELLLREGSP